MKKRNRPILIILGGLAVLAICIAVALGIRTMIQRVKNGGSLFSFPARPTATLRADLGTPPDGTAIAVTPGGLPAGAALPTRPAVSLQEHPCYNLLYPFMPETSWSYDLTARGTTYPLQMTVSSASGSQAEMNLAALPSGFSIQSAMDCNNGGLKNMPLSTTGMLVEDILKSSLSLQYVSGELAPTFDAFEAAGWNLSWSGSYLVSGTGALRFQGNDYSLLVNQAPLTMSCQTAGTGLAAFETLTVRAGTFHALKVTCKITTQATVAFNSWSVTGDVTGQFTEWYAPYVGLVRMQPDSIYVSSPLVGFPVSVANSGVELVEYHAP